MGMKSTINGVTFEEGIRRDQLFSTYKGTVDAEGVSFRYKALTSQFPSEADQVWPQYEYDISSTLEGDYIDRPLHLETGKNGKVLVYAPTHFVSLREFSLGKKVSLSRFRSIAKNLVHAIGVLQTNGVIPDRLHPEAIFVDPKTLEIKLSGLILSKEGDFREISNPNWLFGDGIVFISPEQTGRINRVPDSRSVFYSLGVIFYDLLLGTPPFVDSDPTTIIQGHLAETPDSLHEKNSGIPSQLSDLVLKLLEKSPADRYQSAAGLLSDLEKVSEPDKDSVKLGESDAPTNLAMENKMVGRDKEKLQITQFLDTAELKGTFGFLITGEPGVGKTALVAAAIRETTAKSAVIFHGTFSSQS